MKQKLHINGSATITPTNGGLDIEYDAPDVQHGIDLEACIEVLDCGTDSCGDKADTKPHTRFRLDPADFDGVQSIGIEFVGYNNDTDDRHIWVVEADTGQEVAKVLVPYADGGLFVGTDWQMPPVATDYMLKFERTSNNQSMTAYAFRVLIRQRNATKTRLHFPLGANYNDHHGYVGAAIQKFPPWKRDDSLMGAVAGPWRLEVVAGADADCAGQVSLWNKTRVLGVLSNIPVVKRQVMLHTIDLNDPDAWRDGDEYQLRIEGRGVYVYRAGLSVPLSPIRRAYCPRRVSRYQHSSYNSVYLPTHIDPARYSNPTLLWDVSPADAGTARCELMYQGEMTQGGQGVGDVVASVALDSGCLRVDQQPPPGGMPPRAGVYSARLVANGGQGALGQAFAGVLVQGV